MELNGGGEHKINNISVHVNFLKEVWKNKLQNIEVYIFLFLYICLVGSIGVEICIICEWWTVYVHIKYFSRPYCH